jgi:hypothetical protein
LRVSYSNVTRGDTNRVHGRDQAVQNCPCCQCGIQVGLPQYCNKHAKLVPCMRKYSSTQKCLLLCAAVQQDRQHIAISTLRPSVPVHAARLGRPWGGNQLHSHVCNDQSAASSCFLHTNSTEGSALLLQSMPQLSCNSGAVALPNNKVSHSYYVTVYLPDDLDDLSYMARTVLHLKWHTQSV